MNALTFQILIKVLVIMARVCTSYKVIKAMINLLFLSNKFQLKC